MLTFAPAAGARRASVSRNSKLASAGVFAALLAIVAIALWSALAVSRDLQRVYTLQAELRRAQHLADQCLRLQIDEETALRGFAATRRHVFLEPFFGSEAIYASTLGELGARLHEVGIHNGDPHVATIGMLHARWLREIAAPWLGRRLPARIDVPLQIRGKTFVDRIRMQSAFILGAISGRARLAESEASVRFERVAAGALAATLLIGTLAIFGAIRQRRLQESLDRERSIVETLQRAFINRWDTLPNVSIGTAYESATEDAAVGGDLFDIRRIDERRGYVLIADVSGKGVEAAVDTAFIKYSIRALVRQLAMPDAVLAAFNDLFTEERSSPDSFVVVFLGIVDLERLSLTYASAGHAAAWVRRGPEVRALEVTGPILGVFERVAFETRVVALEPGDVLVLSTDGLTEAREPGGEMLAEEGAAAWIAEADSREPQHLVDGVTGRLRRFIAGPLRDDLAMLALQFHAVRLPARRSGGDA